MRSTPLISAEAVKQAFDCIGDTGASKTTIEALLIRKKYRFDNPNDMNLHAKAIG